MTTATTRRITVTSDPRDITEKQLYEFVRSAAKQFGWRVYHTLNSFGSHKGFPDLVLLNGQRIVWAELKAEKGKVSPDQVAWLSELRSVEPDSAGLWVYLWKPSHRDAVAFCLAGQPMHPDGCDGDGDYCPECGRWRHRGARPA